MRYRGRHRRRPVRTALVVAGSLVVLAAIGALVFPSARGTLDGQSHEGSSEGNRVAAPGSPASDRDRIPRLVPFASWRRLRLLLPATRVLCVCYHEASYHDAMALEPLGRLTRDYNTTKFPRERRDTKGPPYLIMSSRGRTTPATSAADIVVPSGSSIYAPVTGTVTKTRRYRLYGSSPDVRVEIRPVDSPEVRVVMIHMDEVRVRPGDPVMAGVTVLARPRRLPFDSQTDLYIPGGNPHVHLEVVDHSLKR